MFIHDPTTGGPDIMSLTAGSDPPLTRVDDLVAPGGGGKSRLPSPPLLDHDGARCEYRMV